MWLIADNAIACVAGAFWPKEAEMTTITMSRHFNFNHDTLDIHIFGIFLSSFVLQFLTCSHPSVLLQWFYAL